MLKKLLLRIARAAVEMVLSKIAEQMTILEDMVRAPMQAMVNEVVGGMWIGEGADKFVEEVTSLIIPGAERISASCGVTADSITNGLDIMDRADQQVRGLVNDLDGVFQAIY